MDICDVKRVNSVCFDEEVEKILSSLEKTRCEFWNLDRPSANFLNILIKINNSKNVLEIGTSNGYSGIWILEALKETKGKFTTIEFWEKRQRVARKNFEIYKKDVFMEPKIGSAIVVLQDLENEIRSSKREKYDFIFIDANKKEYVDYFEYADKILKIGGIILADNILTHYEKTLPYINLLFENKNYQSQILDIGAGMMISRKLK